MDCFCYKNPKKKERTVRHETKEGGRRKSRRKKRKSRRKKRKSRRKKRKKRKQKSRKRR